MSPQKSKWSLLLCWVERFGDDCLLMVLFNSGVAPNKYYLVWLPNWDLPKHRQYKLISWYHEDFDGALYSWSCFNLSFKITQLSIYIYIVFPILRQHNRAPVALNKGALGPELILWQDLNPFEFLNYLRCFFCLLLSFQVYQLP